MNDVQLMLRDNGTGAFHVDEDGERVAEMVISIVGSNLTVFHTEVADKLQGQGVSGKLLAAMVGYAREKHLKVIPLCPYVSAQFKRHPDLYHDVWNETWHKG
jgi:predicted GNAT family acetyltransferase